MGYECGHSLEKLNQFNHAACLANSEFIAAQHEYNNILEDVRKYMFNLQSTCYPIKKLILAETTVDPHHLTLFASHINRSIPNKKLEKYHNSDELQAILIHEGWTCYAYNNFELQLDI